MSVWCSACRCYVRTPCTSHHQSNGPSSLYRNRYRSTKGASKARRDHINHEIRNMRALLPITSEDQERLSYLRSMAAICTYIRKSVLFQGLSSKEESKCPVPYEAFLQALHGFILVTTAQGKLVYVSENVVEYLGVSMVDVLQGDSLYDMVEQTDIDVVKSNLNFDSNSSHERSFVCAMQTSKAFKLQKSGCCSILVQGSFQFFPLSWDAPCSSSTQPLSEPLFVALCTPTANCLETKDPQFCHTFNSIHQLDMSFSQVSDSVLYYLGYSPEEMTHRSWYGLIHPEDLSRCAESHKTLIQADDGSQQQMVLRLQSKDLSWSWVYVRARKAPQRIYCSNFIISETEARFLQLQTQSEAPGPVDTCHSSAQQPTTSAHKPSKCLKRRHTSVSQSEEPRVRKERRDMEQGQAFEVCILPREEEGEEGEEEERSPGPAMFTPPYTPSSCSSSLSHDLLMDVLSSPEPSSSYFTYPPTALSCGLSPSQSPVSLNPLQQLEHVSLSPVNSLSPLPSSPSPSFDDFSARTPNARLVPDCFSVSCESPGECTLHQDDSGFTEQPQPPGASVIPHVPEHAFPMHQSLLTPSQSPTSLEYSEREREEISILAQQISSLASSFDVFRTLSPLQNGQMSATGAQSLPYRFPAFSSGFKAEPVLDDCIFDSILNDLDLVSGKSCGRNEQRPPGLAESTGVRISMEQNNGLHQLNQFIHGSLQRDGLAEEVLY